MSLDPSVKFYTPFNTNVADQASNSTFSDDSITPWATVSISADTKKLGAGSAQYAIHSFPASTLQVGIRADQYYASAYWYMPNAAKNALIGDFTFYCWVKFPICPGVLFDISPDIQFTNDMHYEWISAWEPPQEEYYATGITNIRGYNAVLSLNGLDIPFSDNAAGEPQNFLYDMNAWHHLAIVRSQNTMYTFLDGDLVDTWTDPPLAWFSNWFGSTLALDTVWNDEWLGNLQQFCKFYPPESGKAEAFIDEVAIVSEALWTADFTPPLYETGAASVVKSATKLLLHMNADDDFVDSSTEVHEVINNAAVHSEITYRLGDASGDFSGGTLTISDTDDWFIFRSTWTIDFWVRLPETEDVTYVIFSQDQNASNYLRGIYDKTAKTFELKLVVGGKILIKIVAQLELLVNTWHHVALAASAFKPVEVP